MPISILYTDSGAVVFIKSLLIDDILNTIKLSSRQRAAKIISNHIMDCLQKMNGILKDKSFKYFAVGAAYGSKDFLKEDDVLNVKSEYVYVITSRELVNKFSLGTISEDDLINSSSVFLKDRDNFDCKRVKINLE